MEAAAVLFWNPDALPEARRQATRAVVLRDLRPSVPSVVVPGSRGCRRFKSPLEFEAFDSILGQRDQGPGWRQTVRFEAEP
jgi:hypothetical protein